MTQPSPQQTVTGIALAALRNDGAGLAVLLEDLTDEEARNAAGLALIHLCSGFRQIIDPRDWQDIIAAMQALAAKEATA